MPELPEVETIARSLRQGGRSGPPIVGRMISGVRLFWARTLAAPLAEPAATPGAIPGEDLLARTVGQSITGVGRRGKFLVISLSEDTLLIHLRMSGDLRVEPGIASGPRNEVPPPLNTAGTAEDGVEIPLLPHDRLVVDFTGGWRMAFNDPRKFGRVWLVREPLTVLGGLGPEPLDPDITAEALYSRLQKVNRQIKPLLLDQAFLAGLGNIYTDEALHMAGIHPLRLSGSISPEEAGKLWAAIRAVLMEGIRRNGASIDWVYRGGDFQNHFRAYQRTGKPCPVCGTPIVRIAVGQRGTHFCPVCQPGPKAA